MVVRVRPAVPEYDFALGNSYFYLERYDDAADAFEDVVKQDRYHAKAQYSLAVCYEKMGQNDKAKRAWQRYLEIDNDSVWAIEARKHLSNLE
jgi:Tfp pilus assembly protein PilF